MSRKVHFSYQGDSWELERVVFQYGFSSPDHPRVIIVSAMHGNEPTGLRALLELKPLLREASARMKGEVIGLIGNFRALEHNRRFIDHDLNRMWNGADIPGHTSEIQEREELSTILESLMQGDGQRYLLDLHTTSSDSAPFMSIADTELNRSFASKFLIPSVAGIERFIKGALLHFSSLHGCVGLAFEAGQHTDPRSVDHHVEFIVESLHHAGILDSDRFDAIGEGPQYDIIHRHAIKEDDGFLMNPGYANFEAVKKGQILAKDNTGEIRAPKDGLLFMPLYQPEGSDGFFIIR